MGYEHYVWRAPVLDSERFGEWAGDVQRIIDCLPDRVPATYYPIDRAPITVQAPLIVAGPQGEGEPWLCNEYVSFNGSGHVEVEGQPQRLRCETFNVDRAFQPQEWDEPDERGWYFESCKTRQQPYDLAVTASLIRLAHRFPEGVEIGSDGGPEEWQPALDLCREVFGHAELPFPVFEARAATAAPDRLNELLAKRDSGHLMPHEVGELRELLDRDMEAGEAPITPGQQPERGLDEPECEP